MSDTTNTPDNDGMSSTTEAILEGEYTPRVIVFDDLGDASLDEAIAGTIVEFEDGDLVFGKVVKVDKDEVLLDIGFKSEGVIPARELSIRHDIDPFEVVHLGEEIEALVLQKEDKRGSSYPFKEEGAI
ncbi:30S ribosomal protein S1 [mine drainage metagenome]|uniref:30S ribosomal protein S1 n=1 Tax=mine drainage metagenome TaxID=410659 RepID=T1A299_9ZZZZ